MFSNDNNVETIAQFVEVVKHYAGLQTEYIKLDIVEKLVRLLTVLAIVVIVALLLIITLIYLSFAGAYALATQTGMAPAFCIVGGVYLLVIILFLCYRKKFIERPLVRLLVNIFLSK